MDEPYNQAPEWMQTVVIIHGTELAHWQQQGYALVTPSVLEKKYTVEEIR